MPTRASQIHFIVFDHQSHFKVSYSVKKIIMLLRRFGVIITQSQTQFIGSNSSQCKFIHRGRFGKDIFPPNLNKKWFFYVLTPILAYIKLRFDNLN